MSDAGTTNVDDLDEDLFNFGELYEEDEDAPSEEMDVEAFLAAAGTGADEADDPAPIDDTPLDTALMGLPSSAELEELLQSVSASGNSGELTRIVKYGGIALIAVNLLAFGGVLLARAGDAAKLESVKDEISRTARDLRQDMSMQVDAIRGVNTPNAVVPLALEPETFDRVRRALDAGDFPSARRQLYAALATADRLEEGQRVSLEAEAGFLLADTYRLEALAREGNQ